MVQAARLAGLGLLIGLIGNIISAFAGGASFALGLIFGLAQLILYGIGIKRIGDITNERKLFPYLVLPQILLVAITYAFLISFGVSFLSLNFEEIGVKFIVYVLVALVVGIVGIVLQVKGYRLLSKVTNIGLFNTAASLYKWGYILLILLIGIILLIIAFIISIVAFFSVKE